MEYLHGYAGRGVVAVVTLIPRRVGLPVSQIPLTKIMSKMGDQKFPKKSPPEWIVDTPKPNNSKNLACTYRIVTNALLWGKSDRNISLDKTEVINLPGVKTMITPGPNLLGCSIAFSTTRPPDKILNVISTDVESLDRNDAGKLGFGYKGEVV